MSTTATPLSAAKIPLINGLRGMAILGVIFHHLFNQQFPQGGYITWLGPLPFSPLTFLSNSYQGVAIFFLLSGFVLTLPYAQKRRTMSSRADVMEFYRRRAARLLPLYFLAVLIGLIFIAATEDPLPFIKNILLLSTGTFTFTESHFFPEANFVLWTLSIELLFCLVFPLILSTMQKYGVWRIVIGCSVGALAARFFGLFLVQIHVASLFTGTTTPIFDNFFCRIDDFVLGMGLAVVYVHRPQLPARWFYPIGFLLVFIGCSLRDFSEVILPIAVQPLSNTFINLGLFSLIAIMLLQPYWLWRVTLENPVLQLLGMMCYSIFIWHGVANNRLQATTDLFHFVRYVVLVVSLSLLTYIYVESSTPKKWRDLLPHRQ
jgi:peptidoglycan/LPS O-acetylase OafA/YrhL